MQLSVRDVAEALRLPPSTVYRWLRAHDVPGTRVLDEFRFNRLDLLEWSFQRGIAIHEDLFLVDEDLPASATPVADAFARGGARTVAGGPLGPDVARGVAEALPELDEAAAAYLLDPLRAGRAPAWQPVPGGALALPRARSPIITRQPDPAIVILYPGRGAAFPATFGPELIRVWIWIFAPAPAVHLFLLERLGRMLFCQKLADVLVAQPGRERMLAEIALREEAGSGKA